MIEWTHLRENPHIRRIGTLLLCALTACLLSLARFGGLQLPLNAALAAALSPAGGIAVLAGMIIVPAVFVFSGGDAAALNKGPGLMFITLPNVFDSMRGGQILGTVFFVLVALAAMTSSISLTETVVSILMEKFNLKRIPACLLTVVICLLLGMLSVLGYSAWSGVEIIGMQFLDFFDFISNNIMMPIVALLTCILIGWVVKPKYVEEEVLVSQPAFRARLLLSVMLRYVCPICMIIILLTPFVTEI